MTHVVMLVTSDLIHDNRVRREAETLAGGGYEVTVFSHVPAAEMSRLGWEGRPGLKAVPAPRAAWTQEAGLRRALGHSTDLYQWGGSGSLRIAARDCRADVFHSHDLDTLPTAAWLAGRHRSRLVYDAHELFVDMTDLGPLAQETPWPSRLKQVLARRNFARLERAHIGRADAVITVSQAIADELSGRYGIMRPELVLNTPPYRDLSSGSAYLRQRLCLGPGERILLFQGGVFPGRGLVELVQSLALMPNGYHLVFLGFNLGTYQEPIRQEVACLGLAARVHLLDALPPEQLLEATSSADIGIMLLAGYNKNERFAMPNKLFEYMMAGLPFISSDWPEVGRVVRLTGAGITVARITPDSIVAAVNQVFSDPARYQALRRAGLEAARTEYNWSRQAERLLALYARIITPMTGARGRILKE